VQRAAPTHQFWNLAVLLFIQSAAMGAWFVPLGTVLDAHGLGSIKAYAFATVLAYFILSYRGRVTPPSKSNSSESRWSEGRGIDQFEA
jgi:hypothetical protein